MTNKMHQLFSAGCVPGALDPAGELTTPADPVVGWGGGSVGNDLKSFDLKS